jgi:hypothetical protein
MVVTFHLNIVGSHAPYFEAELNITAGANIR